MNKINEYKVIELLIDKKFEQMADDIDKDELLSAIGGFVKILSCICERNDIDLQVDIYGNSNNNTSISYDYCYTEDENAD